MTLYDHRPTRFFSATLESHSDSKAGLSASNRIPGEVTVGPSPQREPDPRGTGLDALGQKHWPNRENFVHRHTQPGRTRQMVCSRIYEGEVRPQLIDRQSFTAHVQMHPYPSGDLTWR